MNCSCRQLFLLQFVQLRPLLSPALTRSCIATSVPLLRQFYSAFRWCRSNGKNEFQLKIVHTKVPFCQSMKSFLWSEYFESQICNLTKKRKAEKPGKLLVELRGLDPLVHLELSMEMLPLTLTSCLEKVKPIQS